MVMLFNDGFMLRLIYPGSILRCEISPCAAIRFYEACSPIELIGQNLVYLKMKASRNNQGMEKFFAHQIMRILRILKTFSEMKLKSIWTISRRRLFPHFRSLKDKRTKELKTARKCLCFHFFFYSRVFFCLKRKNYLLTQYLQISCLS